MTHLRHKNTIGREEATVMQPSVAGQLLNKYQDYQQKIFAH